MCTTPKGACVDYVPVREGQMFSVTHQCSTGYTIMKRKCGGVSITGSTPPTVSKESMIAGSANVPSSCMCDFVSITAAGESAYYMVLGCV